MKNSILWTTFCLYAAFLFFVFFLVDNYVPFLSMINIWILVYCLLAGLYAVNDFKIFPWQLLKLIEKIQEGEEND